MDTSLYVESASILPRSFYQRPTVEVARGLLGMLIVNGAAAGRIVEVEAYVGIHDEAAHAAAGLTHRTRVIFGPPGHAYVYLIYGMYECLNLVAEPAGSPGCVLIRALEPVAAISLMRRRRGVQKLEALMSGPGKLTIAMGITRAHNGRDVTRGSFTIRRPSDFYTPEIAVSKRIGIRKAADLELRFFIKDSRFVSASS